MQKISVIVPVYHGKKYIQSMIQQIQDAAKEVSFEAHVELIFSNDAPDDTLEKEHSDIVDILVLNTEINRGIHGARVQGLQYATGEYVLFLDQDDKIRKNYLKSQLSCIRGYDASICKVIQSNNLLYVNANLDESKFNQSSLLNGNVIASPGQVLIKREAIPPMWCENIMKHNGADDWFLWLCMQAEGKTFTINPELLYEHIEHGLNATGNFIELKKSVEEVYSIAKHSQLFSSEELLRLENTVIKIGEFYLVKLSQYMRFLYFIEEWMNLENRDHGIAAFFKMKGINQVAIYGYGYMGRLICDRLIHNGIDVKYLMDQNAKYLNAELPVFTLDEKLPETEAVLVSLLDKEDKVVDRLRCSYDVPIWTVKEIIAVQRGGESV